MQKLFGDARRTQIVDKVEEMKLGRFNCRYRYRHHCQPRRIHEAHVGGCVPRSNARRQRPHRCKNTRRGFRRASFHRLGDSYILLFTSKGRVYWLKIHEIPEAAAATRGGAISSLVKFQMARNSPALVSSQKSGRRGPARFHGDEKWHGEENSDCGILKPASIGNYCHQIGKR